MSKYRSTMRFWAGTNDDCSAIWAIAFGVIGTFLRPARGLGFFSLILGREGVSGASDLRDH
jgi:hypothetical protein